ncbi:hypothetical protein SAMN05660359_03397 [Geodermatophilus obscurus]|uniref:Uncharacterized protein n=1 Tax=Geodermatophilus obscurus TaxID=1861 RepID=A0A1I5H4T1_9ACTN|nr:hypothetical protein SAMN05660359_03397 [Geodermatophilus obscurus]
MALGTALLAGCASEAAEAPSESLPSTSSPAPTTEALPAVGPADFPVPPEARTKDAAGAEAFLRYWIDLLNRQRAIPAGQPLRDLGPDCQECLRIATNYDDAAAVGSRYIGGEVSLVDVPSPIIEGDTAKFSFSARREPVSLVDSAGTEIEGRAEVAPRLFSGLYLIWSTSTQSWLVTAFQLG